MDQLKKCFMCGGKVEMMTVDGGQWMVFCAVKGCNLILDFLGTNKREAIREYNRVASAPLPQ